MMSKDHREDGLSMVELIVVVVIIGLLALVIGTIFSNTWKAQEAVRTQSEATTTGQLVASEIEKAMRNATDFDVTPDGLTLEVNTSLSEGLTQNRRCQAFTFAADGVHMTIGPAPAPTSVWPLWKRDVSGGSFTVSGNAVTYNFSALSKSGGTVWAAPVRFSGTSYMRGTGAGDMSPCW